MISKKLDDKILKCDDPEQLSAQDREEYLRYWASRTPTERLNEIWRLNVIKYDLKPPYRMDKSHKEVVTRTKYEK